MGLSAFELASNKANEWPMDNVIELLTRIKDGEQTHAEFVWRLLTSRPELDLYMKTKSAVKRTLEPDKKKQSSIQTYKIDSTKIINHAGNRGYSSDYYTRKCVSHLFRVDADSPEPVHDGQDERTKSFAQCLKELEIS